MPSLVKPRTKIYEIYDIHTHQAVLLTPLSYNNVLHSQKSDGRLSVTRRYCVRTKNVSGLISSPSLSPVIHIRIHLVL